MIMRDDRFEPSPFSDPLLQVVSIVRDVATARINREVQLRCRRLLHRSHDISGCRELRRPGKPARWNPFWIRNRPG